MSSVTFFCNDYDNDTACSCGAPADLHGAGRLRLNLLIKKIFIKYGLDLGHAKICADALINAELVGAPTHGLSRLKMYCDRISKKLINPRPKIKVRKIFAVREIGDNKYTDKQIYWLNSDTNIIYDYELEFAIGKILLTEYGIPNKLDKNTFIIDDIIDIPKLIIS